MLGTAPFRWCVSLGGSVVVVWCVLTGGGQGTEDMGSI